MDSTKAWPPSKDSTKTKVTPLGENEDMHAV